MTISRELLSLNSEDEILSKAKRLVAHHFGAHMVSVITRNESDYIDTHRWYPDDPCYQEDSQEYGKMLSGIESVFQSGEPAKLQLPAPNPISLMFFPIVDDQLIHAVLGVGFKSEKTWDTDFSAALADLARLIGSLITREQRYHLALDSTTEHVIYHDLDLRIISANQSAAQSVNLSLQELIGSYCYEIWHNRPDPCPNCPILRALEEKRPASAEIKTPDGRIWRIRGFPVFDSQGKVISIAELTSEITEQKKVEKAIMQERERLDLVLEGGRIGTWIWDVKTNKVILNELWAAMLGYTLKDISPHSYETWSSRVHPDDLPGAIEKLEKCINGDLPEYECEYRMRHKQGHWVWIFDRGRILDRDDEGQPVAMFGTHTDITDRMKTQNDLLQFEWLLEKETARDDRETWPYNPRYSDVTQLNTSRVILDAVGKERLEIMARDLMDLLDTSVAVYEVNGDYAFGLFASQWCRLFDGASFDLCHTSDTAKALNSGLWQCHECCWHESAVAAMKSGQPTDIKCVGGINLYAVPILVQNEVIGVINIGYGTPPQDDATLKELAEKFNIPENDVKSIARQYRPRPQYIIDIAKRRCQSVAMHISEIVARTRAQQVRHEQEKRLARLMNNLPGMAYRCPNTPGWPAIFVSKGSVAITGYTPEELTGEGDPVYADLVHPDDREGVEETVNAAVAQNKPFMMEYRLHDRQGKIRWVWEHGQAVGTDESGNPVLEGFVYDITERKIAEEAVQAARNRLEVAIAGGGLGTWEWIVPTGEIILNDRWSTMLGFEPGEVGLRLECAHELTDPEALPRLHALMKEHLLGATPHYEAVYRMRHKSGDWVWIHDRGQVTERDSNGSPYRVCGTHADISPLMKAEQELRESEAKFRSYVEEAPIGVFIANQSGDYIDVNPAATTITGYTREELLTKTILDLIPLDNHDLALNHFKRVTETGYADGVVSFKQKNGRVGRWSVTAVRLSNQRFLGFVQDITQRQQLEDQLRNSQKLEAVGQLAGGVAHDFNNLLMGILGYTDLCRDELDISHPVHEYLDEITNGAQRSADIVRQLLAFSRKQTIAPKVLNLNDTIETMLKMLRHLIGEDIDLHWQPGSGLRIIRIDPGQVDQILANLCINARDAIGGVGKITIETANATLDDEYCASHADTIPGNYTMLAVSDNGCGMNSEILNHIFDPFYTTKAPGEGTGLGLAMVYGIVKQNSGTINVYSELGQGSTFRIYFPSYKVASKVTTSPPTITQIPCGSETIMIVEDEKSIRQTTSMHLKKLGYTVLIADSPQQALELAEDHGHHLDALITDVVMPGMNGRQLAELLIAKIPKLKVLYISGYTENVIAHRGILKDNVEFLPKPFLRYELARKVRDLLDGTGE